MAERMLRLLGDGDLAAGCVILEAGRRPQVGFRRLGYDVVAAARAVPDSAWPPHAVERLTTGGEQGRRVARGECPA
jgi:hypothetical protein